MTKQDDEFEHHRKAFEEAQAGLKMSVFEAVRAQTVNRYKLEEAIKKYFDRQQQYLAKLHERIVELSKASELSKAKK